ncbi:hypothetical protein WMF45_26635 [Sorangium sp. So ce448]|uniref:hypothetical protein n=1 Tax=Sorangium sp. So ce448 TaxID=3133314 RepID=UPI003F61767C
MSVTQLVQRKDVRDILDRVIPPYKRAQRTVMRVLGSSCSPRLVGTAFDYALRFDVLRRCPRAHDRPWVAEASIERLEGRLASVRAAGGPMGLAGAPSALVDGAHLRRIVRRARRRVENARTFLRKHIRRRACDRSWMTRLAEHSLKLARLDAIYRAGYLGDDLFADNTPELRDQVVSLLEHAAFDTLLDGADVVLNPTFGACSRLVGGADADLLVGGRLIDLKVSARDDVERPMVRQLVAYLILAERARREGQPLPQITSLELYFARHAHLWTLRADQILTHPEYPEVERRFFEIAVGVMRRASTTPSIVPARVTAMHRRSSALGTSSPLTAFALAARRPRCEWP